MNECDVLLLSIPPLELRAPLIGIALLKSVIEKNTKYKVFCADLNLDLYNQIKDVNEDFANECESGRNSLLFQFEIEYRKFYVETYSDILDQWVDNIVETKAKYVGISAFSDACLFTIRDLVLKLKIQNPKIQIIVGGGAARPIMKKHGQSNWIKNIDHIVFGDGEQAILDILNGGKANTFPFTQIEKAPDINLIDMPFPDYSDFDLGQYNSLYITGSRGCVRDCTFCDIRSLFGKYRARPSDKILQEMMYQIHTNNTSFFHFTDSLINGSMKYFLDFIRSFSDLKTKKNLVAKWDSHYIVRNIKIMKPEYFQILAESNCHLLKIGAESGSADVRKHMAKDFEREELDYTIEEIVKNRMLILFSIIVGYPTETDKDFQDTIDMFADYKKYDKLIMSCNIMNILEDTPIEKWGKENGITYDKLGNWVYKNNNFVLRAERQNILLDELEKMGYNVAATKRNKIEYIKELYK